MSGPTSEERALAVCSLLRAVSREHALDVLREVLRALRVAHGAVELLGYGEDYYDKQQPAERAEVREGAQTALYHAWQHAHGRDDYHLISAVLALVLESSLEGLCESLSLWTRSTNDEGIRGAKRAIRSALRSIRGVGRAPKETKTIELRPHEESTAIPQHA